MKRSFRILGGLLFLAGVFASISCGPSYPGEITLVAALDQTPMKAVAVNGNYLYAVDENGKMKVFDISKPEKGKRVLQIDAFKGDIYGLFLISADRMLLLAKDGRMMLFDIALPQKPEPVWGPGKTLKLPAVGPFVFRPKVSALYIAPPSGPSLVRIDFTVFNKFDAKQSDIDGATKKFGSGGGGGIALLNDHQGNPVRIFVGSTKEGSVALWNVVELESGSAQKPSTVVKLKSSSPVKALFSYKEKPDAIEGSLIAYSQDGTIEVLTFGRYFKNISDPKSLGTAEIKNLLLLDPYKKLAVTTQLELYDLSKSFTEPSLFAAAQTRGEIDIRQIAAYGDKYLFTAEGSGLQIYKYQRKK